VRNKRDRLIEESADLMYHLLVLWADARISPREVWAELARREGVSGIEEKEAREKD
jgi:phosphoribosyl-ATP pyrophosphohydrolase